MAMKAPKPVRAFLWILASLACVAVLAVLDWYPTVKELGRLRRERGDLATKTKNYAGLASSFIFPDQEEEDHFQRSCGDFSRELPQVEDDASWSRRWTSWLRRQAGKDRLAGALLLISATPGGEMEPWVRLTGQGPAAVWLTAQLPGIQKSLREASPDRFPWRSLFSAPPAPLAAPLASRPLAVAMAAPLPALLNFINHCSWNMRLEIVRLRLEPGPVLAQAWLACRSSYQARGPSPWGVKLEAGGAGEGLLVDPDSSLLWQRVEPGIACRAVKKELPPPGSPW
jgi:hypothetical protein